MVEKFRTRALAEIHEVVTDLHTTGGIDKITMKKFEELLFKQKENPRDNDKQEK